ncbi:MAG: hypothetical protein N4A33_06275 [Bacteriovoracaceae bacterium]|jgi:hypothetical protein|nr:hypothetical protein [Bacteriovoracaceae bacterium]
MKLTSFAFLLFFSVSALAHPFAKFIGTYSPLDEVESSVEDQSGISYCEFKSVLDLRLIEIKANFKGEYTIRILKNSQSDYYAKEQKLEKSLSEYKKTLVFGYESFATFEMDYFIPDSVKPRQKLEISISRVRDHYNLFVDEKYLKNYISKTSHCRYEVKMEKL